MRKSNVNNQPFADIALEAVKKIQNQLLLYGIVETVLLACLIFGGKNIPFGYTPIVYAVVILPILIALCHVVLQFYSLRMNNRTKPHALPQNTQASALTQWTGGSTAFCWHVEELMKKAQRMVLIGTGLNILQRDTFALEIMHRAMHNHSTLEIYLADFDSPDIELRLIEEEMGDIKPTVAKDGLSRHLEKLKGVWKDLKFPTNISINLFTNYPTFALIIVDSEYFIYPYGYANLGNFSPVIHFSKSRDCDQVPIEFCERQYRTIKAAAQDVRFLEKVRNKEELDPRSLYPVALYIVPPPDSKLYRFGSTVLGFDVHKQTSTESPWKSQVGSACDFGFHCTVCDALYFSNKQIAQMAIAEMSFVAQRFKPFFMENLAVKRHFPNQESLAITAQDLSGNLEAFHCELVSRIYRRAVGSNYSMPQYPLARMFYEDREKLMIEHYHAPYVLQRFQPHFTLLTDVAKGSYDSVAQEIETAFSKEVEKRTLKVESLAIMSRPNPHEPWCLDGMINLGK